jgi:hypothetical protein
MLFSELDAGDVFVLRWWLDTGPTLRHYLVVKRAGAVLYILRLEHEDHKLLEVDSTTFDDIVTSRDVFLTAVYKFTGGTLSSPPNGR